MDRHREPGSFQDLSRRLLASAFPEQTPAQIAERARQIADEVSRELGPTSRAEDHRPPGTTLVLTEPGSHAVYYQDARITIRADAVIVGGLSCRIQDIERAYRSRSPGSRKAALIAAAIGVALAGWPLVAGPFIVALLILMGTLLAAAVAYDRGSAHEIWIVHRRTPVLLFVSRDHTRTGRVSRALMRAIENHHAGGGGRARD